MDKQPHRALVEKVARIIDPGVFDDDFPLSQRAARKMATAAIAAVYEALREPSREMYSAAYEALVPCSDANACWQAMLSASPIVQEE